MALTKAQRAERAAERAASAARIEAAHAEMREHVRRGTCPQCSAKLMRNTSIAGWWQCAQYGAIGFRADASKPACSFQGFTE